MAAVARSKEGLFLGLSTLVFPANFDVDTLEAMAYREAYSLTCDINARQNQVASDCHNVVTSFEQGLWGDSSI
jgi:hypothetical protein